MNYTVYDQSGTILRTGSCPEEDVLKQIGPNEFVVPIGSRITDRVNVGTAQVIDCGTRPSEFYDWNAGTSAWVGNVDRLRESKRAVIERARDARAMAPTITYDGSVLDADARAIDNVKSKLMELDSRTALGQTLAPAMCIWRTYDNTNRSFPDQATYFAWVQGLAIVLGSRGTMAYAWSWAKKAALDSLTTFADVQAFDPAA